MPNALQPVAALCLLLVASTTHAQALPAGEELGEIEADGSEEGETQAIVIQSTRIQRRVGDEPIRMEVLNREEVEEKILMRPGNIPMRLSETGGLRVQVTSPALGAANIRVQGLEGRYTQLLADGLPLHGGQASFLGLLQIWTVRASYGRRFFAPTPFVDEIEAAGLQRVEPLGDLRAEKGETASLEVGYARGCAG